MTMQSMATRLCGSADLFATDPGRGSTASVNYVACHDGFTTAEGVAIAGKCGMSERSFKRFLRDRKGVLFAHSSHGNYTKL